MKFQEGISFPETFIFLLFTINAFFRVFYLIAQALNRFPVVHNVFDMPRFDLVSNKTVILFR